jgi:hypothetical protein
LLVVLEVGLQAVAEVPAVLEKQKIQLQVHHIQLHL